ncbi:MAG: DUF4430 domain-containing protein [Faecalibacterium sp.]
MKRDRIFSILAASALVAAVLLTGCGSKSDAASSSAAASSQDVSSTAAVSQAEAAAIKVTFTVSYADGSADTLELDTTEGETLAQALANAGVISQEEADAGFVTVVNGVTADWNKDHAWWCLTDASGEATTVGVGSILLHDGDSYAFAYTK